MSEPARTDAARGARLSRPPSSPPVLALLGDVAPEPLRAGGWSVRGRLVTGPFDVAADTPAYFDLDDVLADPQLDAVAVDASDPALAALLPELRGAGLLLLLSTPAPLDPDAVRAARAVGDLPESVVGLLDRWEPWARVVDAAVPLAGGPPLQVTVRGWPRGPAAAAELVDLVTGWCGDVVAGAALPAEQPARELAPPSEGSQRSRERRLPVVWSLLTASGATVLVAHEGERPLVRLSFATARLEAGPDGARWVGGAELPLPAPPRWVPPVPPGVRVGLVAGATALTRALGGGDLHPAETTGTRPPAGLGDLLVAARVLEALRHSARSGRVERMA